ALEHSEASKAVEHHEAEVARAREQLGGTERSHDAARDGFTRAQIDRAQLEARLQVATDRERRLEQESELAASRIGELQSELLQLSESDSSIAEAMSAWRVDLEAREAALIDGDAHLAAAERGVLEANERLTAAEHALDET